MPSLRLVYRFESNGISFCSIGRVTVASRWFSLEKRSAHDNSVYEEEVVLCCFFS